MVMSLRIDAADACLVVFPAPRCTAWSSAASSLSPNWLGSPHTAVGTRALAGRPDRNRRKWRASPHLSLHRLVSPGPTMDRWIALLCVSPYGVRDHRCGPALLQRGPFQTYPGVWRPTIPELDEGSDAWCLICNLLPIHGYKRGTGARASRPSGADGALDESWSVRLRACRLPQSRQMSDPRVGPAEARPD
jgi:hypothetical protein